MKNFTTVPWSIPGIAYFRAFPLSSNNDSMQPKIINTPHEKIPWLHGSGGKGRPLSALDKKQCLIKPVTRAKSTIVFTMAIHRRVLLLEKSGSGMNYENTLGGRRLLRFDWRDWNEKVIATFEIKKKARSWTIGDP